MTKLTTRDDGNPAPVNAELFGSHLRELRRRAGLTQQALAAACGVQRNSMNMIEMGRRFPSSGLLKKLCDTVAPEDSIARTRLLFALINEAPSALPEGIPPTHGKAAETDDLTIERVERWLRERVAKFRRYSVQHRIPIGRLPDIVRTLETDAARVCSGISAIESAVRHLDDAHRILSGVCAPAEVSAPTAPRAAPTSPATGNAQRSGARWRKRPLSEKERDDLRMELLRARAAGPEALARVKREIGKRHGLHPRWVASLLNTCVGKRFALNFAARVVSRAPQIKRQAQLIVQLSNLLDLKQDRILRAVREIGRD